MDNPATPAVLAPNSPRIDTEFRPPSISNPPLTEHIRLSPSPAQSARAGWLEAAGHIMSSWGFKPSFRVSVTGECNASCKIFGCHNEGNSKDALGLPAAAYQPLARSAVQLGLKAVKLTGGEPCTRSDLPDVVHKFVQAGFEDKSIVSNGSMLTPSLQQDLKDAGLDRLTVSLHTLQPGRYQQMMGLDPALLHATRSNLESAAAIFPGNLKLNAVFVPGFNFPGEVIQLVRYANALKATLSVLSTLRGGRSGPPLSQLFRKIVEENFEIIRITSSSKRLVNVQTLVLAGGGAVELDDFRLNEAIDAKNKNPYCAACSLRNACTEGPYAFRVTANGRFKPCLLRRDNEVPTNVL